MRYEFYDRDGKLLGLLEVPEGTPIEEDEEIFTRFDGHTANRWEVIAAFAAQDGVQKLRIRPI